MSGVAIGLNQDSLYTVDPKVQDSSTGCSTMFRPDTNCECRPVSRVCNNVAFYGYDPRQLGTQDPDILGGFLLGKGLFNFAFSCGRHSPLSYPFTPLDYINDYISFKTPSPLVLFYEADTSRGYENVTKICVFACIVDMVTNMGGTEGSILSQSSGTSKGISNTENDTALMNELTETVEELAIPQPPRR